MVVKIHCEAILKIRPAVYWAIRHAPDYLKIECRVLNNGAKRLLSETLNDDGAVVKQELLTEPDVSLVPQFVLNLGPKEGVVLVDTLEYRLDHPDTPYFHTIRTRPSFMSERCDIRGELMLIPTKDGHSCTQVIDMEVSLKVFAVGSIIEQVVAKGLRNAYAKLPEIVEEWKAQSMKLTDWTVPAPWQEEVLRDKNHENESAKKDADYNSLPAGEMDLMSQGSATTGTMSPSSKSTVVDSLCDGETPTSYINACQPIPSVVTAQPEHSVLG